MAGRRVCHACYNARCRARYASPRPLTRTQGRRSAAHRAEGEAWCWWCQQTHGTEAFARNAATASGLQHCCKDGMRTLYRLRTLGKARCPARGRRRPRDDAV